MTTFIGNVEIDVDDLEILEKLVNAKEENAIFIYDEKLRSALGKMGFIQTNILNWSWGTNKLRIMLPEIEKLMFAEQVLTEG